MALAAVVLAIGVTSSSAATPAQGTAKLSKEDRALLAQARLNNQSQVDLIIAAKPGANQKVADAVAALGANIRYREDTVDYVRALVPTDRVEAVAGLDGVEAVAFNVLVPIEDPRPEEGSSEAVPTPPGPGTPAENPQLPTRDIGAPQFVASHPTHDGRGVVIGILDTGIDVLTPELQTAKKLDGTPTRKIIDWKNFNDPLSGLDPSWVNMETLVTVSAGSFSSGAVTYTGVPADGTYQFGVFDESAISAASEYAIDCGAKTSGADLNRDGVCGEKFAVLWNTGDNTVRVDANADHSFAGEPAMRDYAVNFDIGIGCGSSQVTTPSPGIEFPR